MGMDPDPDGDTFLVTTELYNPNSITTNQNSYNTSEWKCRLFGIDNCFFITSKGNEPNWFWRAMQYILIGNKWSKNESS